MKQWVKFFVGTPQRFLVTLAVLTALGAFTSLCPGILNSACQQLVAEIQPIVALAIQLGITIAVVAFMLKALIK